MAYLHHVYLWLTARAADARRDDRGSILSEYGILLGLMSVGAVAVAAFVISRTQGWLDSIPTP